MSKRKKHLHDEVEEALQTLSEAFTDLHERLDAVEAARFRGYSREEIIEEVIRRLAIVRRRDSALVAAGEKAVRQLVADLLSLDVSVPEARERFAAKLVKDRSRSRRYDVVRDVRLLIEEVVVGKPPRPLLTKPITTRGTARRPVPSK